MILFIVLIWTYTIPWALMPVMGVWGRFVPEGFLTSCSFDYLTDTNEIRTFVAVIFTFSYCIPMLLIIYYYSQIVSHVVNHEKALREQAKKMNVDSLRSNANTNSQSAEIRIAKVFKWRHHFVSLFINTLTATRILYILPGEFTLYFSIFAKYYYRICTVSTHNVI